MGVKTSKYTYNQYRRAWKVYPKRHIVSRLPIHLDIELTNRCDRECEMCPFHGKQAQYKREPEDMDFEMYKRIIDEGASKGLYSIKLNYGGEPLLYPYLIDAIAYAKARGIMDVHINSNGIKLTKKLVIGMISSGLDLFILSDYDLSIQHANVIVLKAIRDVSGSEKPKIRVKTENPEKWEGIADEIVGTKFYDYNNLEYDSTPSKFECEQPWRRFLILSDGTVCRCSCGMLLPDKIMGNINCNTIEELWNSEYMNYLRFCHEEHCTELLESCACCPVRIEFINQRGNKK